MAGALLLGSLICAADERPALDPCLSQLAEQCAPYAGLEAIIRCAWLIEDRFDPSCRKVIGIGFRAHAFQIEQQECGFSPRIIGSHKNLCREAAATRIRFAEETSGLLRVLFRCNVAQLYERLKRASANRVFTR